MSLLERFADKYIGPALTRAGDHLMDATMGMPGSAGERELMRLHDKWLQTAKLGVRYYAPHSKYEWVEICQAKAVLVCRPTYVFTRRTKGGLYTDAHCHSYRAWTNAGFGGLTTVAPPVPEPPVDFQVKGDLMDDPRKWTITYE